jgi:hypothetical protein
MSHSSTLSSTSDGKERKLESADALRAFGPSSKMAGSFRPPTILGPQVGRGGGFMCISKPAVEANSHSSARRALVREKHVRQQHATTAAQLNNALAREEALLCEKSDLLRRHEMMAQEFEHRLFNSLRLIVSLLWLQSRAASTPEAATQLSIAADRVAAFGTRAPAAACARSSGESGVQAIYPSPVRGPFGFALPGRSESRHRGGGCGCRDTDSTRHPAGVYHQRAHHQFGKIRQRHHHRSIGNGVGQ